MPNNLEIKAASDSKAHRQKLALLAVAAAVCICAVFLFIRPMPQWQGYHNFADKRAILGIPNTFDVLSNIAFLLAGTAGLLWTQLAIFRDPRERWIWYAVFAGAIATAAGSGYYH